MRLTIDTKHDSHEEIKHAIQILSHILEKKGYSTPSEASPEATANMMSMFDPPSSGTTQESSTPMTMFGNTEPRKEVPDTGPDFTSFLNLANQNKEEPKEDPKVEYF